jgi:SynChlorMet cassette radical SAM/SPASM protein ScmF
VEPSHARPSASATSETPEQQTAPAAENGGIPPLGQLYFYLTAGCNLACRHCYLAPKFDPGARAGVLPVEAFETAIREAKPLGLEAVKLTGGEPLLHPRIADLLDIVRREDLTMRMETNGVLLTPELARKAAECKEAFVSVSLDGADAGTHDWIRGISGSFERAGAAVRTLAGAGVKPQVIFTVMRRNEGQVEAVIRLAEDLGAGSLKFNVVQPMGRGEKFGDGASGLSVAEIIQLGRRVDMELSKTTALDLYFDYPAAFRPLSRMASGDGCGVCGILGILGVIPTGHYAICGVGEMAPELVYGEIGRDRLEEVWRGHPKLLELREGLPERLGGICARCLMKHACLGSCVAQNYYRAGTLLAPYWFCEEAAAAGLFPASRLGEKKSEALC